jgi:ribonuclease D
MQDTLPSPARLIDTAAQLEEMVEDLAANQQCLAVDTEFVWERTYYPALGIVQVGTADGQVFLVDAAALDDLAPLGRLLSEPRIVKILHDAQQDLTILRRATGAYPRNIFDTRCAAAFAGLTSTMSLRDLLQELLDIELSKTETRADWLRRPLSEAMISYAAEDVLYLPRARQVLLERVEKRGRLEWLHDELDGFDRDVLYDERDPEIQYLRVKGGGRLGQRELAVLRQLTAWREHEARGRDRPRSHIASDTLLLHLAQRRPRRIDDMSGLRDMSSRKAGQYGEAMLQAIGIALDLPVEQCPTPLRRRRDEAVLRQKLGHAIDHLRSRSEAMEMDPPFVASRAELKALVRDPAATGEDHRLLRGWRRDFLGTELLDILSAPKS